MNEQVKTFLEDTRDILSDYDGAKTVEQLKSLIDEAAARINAATTGTIQQYEDSL